MKYWRIFRQKYIAPVGISTVAIKILSWRKNIFLQKKKSNSNLRFFNPRERMNRQEILWKHILLKSLLSPKILLNKRTVFFLALLLLLLFFVQTSLWINKYFLLVRCHLHLNTRTYLPPTVTHAIKNGVSEWEEKSFYLQIRSRECI